MSQESGKGWGEWFGNFRKEKACGAVINRKS